MCVVEIHLPRSLQSPFEQREEEQALLQETFFHNKRAKCRRDAFKRAGRSYPIMKPFILLPAAQRCVETKHNDLASNNLGFCGAFNSALPLEDLLSLEDLLPLEDLPDLEDLVPLDCESGRRSSSSSLASLILDMEETASNFFYKGSNKNSPFQG